MSTTATVARIASVEITRRCNNRCDYCHVPKEDRDMPVELFQRIVDTLEHQGYDAVALGGGEPTLHARLRAMLTIARARGLLTGLTTNAQDSELVETLAGEGLLDSFGVSAGKGNWEKLAGHPLAVVNLLLVANGLYPFLQLAARAISAGARRLLLLACKSTGPELVPGERELSDAFALLRMTARGRGIVIAVDDYTRRRLSLSNQCGRGFVRIGIDGDRDFCCYPECEYRPEQAPTTNRPSRAYSAPSLRSEHLAPRIRHRIRRDV